MRVDIDYVLFLKEELRQINSGDLEDITWIRNGGVVDFDKNDITDWKYTGLSNADFVEIFPNTQRVVE